VPAPDSVGGPVRDPSPFPLLDSAAPAGPPDDDPTQVVGSQPGPFGLGGFGAERRRNGARPDRTGAAILVVLGLVVVLLVAAVIGARALLGGSSGSTYRDGSNSPSASPTGSASMPAGFRRYEHPGGFSVAVPQRWTPVQRRTGVIDVQEPGSSRFLRLIRADSSASAQSQLASAEPGFINPDHPGYRRLRLEKVPYRGYDSADWEFTFSFSTGGTLRHVLYRAVVVHGASYGLYLSAPDSEWSPSRRIFDVAVSTFDPSA
jgi:hypothetical protein